MGSRDIWSHGSGTQVPDLLTSALGALLLQSKDNRPAYFTSPYMSDFVLFANRFKQFGSLVPDMSDEGEILFSVFLGQLSRTRSVRVVTCEGDSSRTFLSRLSQLHAPQLEWRIAPADFHEKGILAPSFYIEGSMNITYSGVYVNDEKITFHSATTEAGVQKVVTAYLEFDRQWKALVPRDA